MFLCLLRFCWLVQLSLLESPNLLDGDSLYCTNDIMHSLRLGLINWTFRRKVIRFNPSHSKNLVTNIGKTFLQLIDKHFPKSSRLHKIFNRNSIKISYSRMKNVNTTISNHNTRTRSTQPTAIKETRCNCRKKDEYPHQKNYWPMQAIVHQAEVNSHDNGDTISGTLE
jgi:hypothetical protein